MITPDKLLFKSKEFKQLLNITDCKLMHLRQSGNIPFIKQGNAYLYQLEDEELLLNHPLAHQIFSWYKVKHNVTVENLPQTKESKESVIALIKDILLPIQRNFGEIQITYGFVSPDLNRYIQKNSSSGTCPSIDQHSSSELNKNNNLICKRNGLACDFLVVGFEESMNIIVEFIVKNLMFDKIYHYGNNRPLHVSVSSQPMKHLQLMNSSSNGRRIPGKKAFEDKAKELAGTLSNEC